MPEPGVTGTSLMSAKLFRFSSRSVVVMAVLLEAAGEAGGSGATADTSSSEN